MHFGERKLDQTIRIPFTRVLALIGRIVTLEIFVPWNVSIANVLD